MTQKLHSTETEPDEINLTDSAAVWTFFRYAVVEVLFILAALACAWLATGFALGNLSLSSTNQSYVKYEALILYVWSRAVCLIQIPGISSTAMKYGIALFAASALLYLVIASTTVV